MGVNESLCVGPDGQSTYKWCTFQATDNYSIIVQLSYVGILLLVATVALRYYMILIKYRTEGYNHLFGNVFVRIYKLLALWVIFSMIKSLINLYVYFEYMIQDFKVNLTKNQLSNLQYQETVPSNSPIVILSAVFNVFNFLSTYVILHLMILIPYLWIKTSLMSINDKHIQKIEIRKQIQRYFKIIWFVNIYLQYVRSTFLLFVFSQPFLLFFTNTPCDLHLWNYKIYLVEAVLILIFYIIGLFAAIFLLKNKLITIKTKDYKRIRNQYIMLISILIVRIIINFIYRSLDVYKYQPTKNCSDTQILNKIIQTIFTILFHYILHTYTAVILLYIYRPDIQQQQGIFSILIYSLQDNNDEEVYYQKTATNFNDISLGNSRKEYKQIKSEKSLSSHSNAFQRHKNEKKGAIDKMGRF